MDVHRMLLEDVEEMVANQDAKLQLDTSQPQFQLELEASLWYHWTFGMSQEGWTAVVPEHTEVGDLLFNVAGLDVIFVLRKQAAEGVYSLVGQAVVVAHGFDYGRALALSRESGIFPIC